MWVVRLVCCALLLPLARAAACANCRRQLSQRLWTIDGQGSPVGDPVWCHRDPQTWLECNPPPGPLFEPSPASICQREREACPTEHPPPEKWASTPRSHFLDSLMGNYSGGAASNSARGGSDSIPKFGTFPQTRILWLEAHPESSWEDPGGLCDRGCALRAAHRYLSNHWHIKTVWLRGGLVRTTLKGSGLQEELEGLFDCLGPDCLTDLPLVTPTERPPERGAYITCMPFGTGLSYAWWCRPYPSIGGDAPVPTETGSQEVVKMIHEFYSPSGERALYPWGMMATWNSYGCATFGTASYAEQSPNGEVWTPLPDTLAPSALVSLVAGDLAGVIREGASDPQHPCPASKERPRIARCWIPFGVTGINRYARLVTLISKSQSSRPLDMHPNRPNSMRFLLSPTVWTAEGQGRVDLFSNDPSCGYPWCTRLQGGFDPGSPLIQPDCDPRGLPSELLEAGELREGQAGCFRTGGKDRVCWRASPLDSPSRASLRILPNGTAAYDYLSVRLEIDPPAPSYPLPAQAVQLDGRPLYYLYGEAGDNETLAWNGVYLRRRPLCRPPTGEPARAVPVDSTFCTCVMGKPEDAEGCLCAAEFRAWKKKAVQNVEPTKPVVTPALLNDSSASPPGPTAAGLPPEPPLREEPPAVLLDPHVVALITVVVHPTLIAVSYIFIAYTLRRLKASKDRKRYTL